VALNDNFHIAYIGVGSNIGKKVDTCRKAIAAVSACENCTLDVQSFFYETEPVGLEDQDWFVNGVIRIRTGLEPKALHKQLQAIEQRLGRRHGGPRFGPRVLDLDILFFDDLIVQTAKLKIPHPRLHERRFVLRPLCDIAPELMHPKVGQTVHWLLSNLKDAKKVTFLE